MTRGRFRESEVGGYSALDQRLLFYNRVRALLDPQMIVLDFGAGRGKWHEVESGWKREVTLLRGHCREVIGFDTDEAVLENPDVDRGVVAEPGAPLPLADGSVDLIVSWAVFEHISDPHFYAEELKRVLKPGGWLCAWTPNRWAYFSLGAQLIPPTLQEPLLRWLDRERDHHRDTFPTHYRLNTRRAIRKHFPPAEFEDYSFLPLADAGYHGGWSLLAALWDVWIRCAPRMLRPYLHVFLRRRPSAQSIREERRGTEG